MRTFDEVGRTPVLLSMLILVLGEQRRGALALPADIHSLYGAAIRAAVRRPNPNPNPDPNPDPNPNPNPNPNP